MRKVPTHPEKVPMNTNKIFASSSLRHFSEVHDQVLKRSTAMLCTWGGALGPCRGGVGVVFGT
jgi:hypothetical protein